jgi:Aromatic-ring-opening dioxygenase LigAB, LigA subunit
MAAMSLYALQKLIRDVNRKPACREAFFQSPETFATGYELAAPEREALIRRDVRTLYAMGVHGLLLRPFTLLHQMPEPDYLEAIRGE